MRHEFEFKQTNDAIALKSRSFVDKAQGKVFF